MIELWHDQSPISRRRFGGIAAAACGAHLNAQDPVIAKINVTNRRLSDVPSKRGFLGHFVEAGFGRQVEGMWSELIYNRSFQTIPPYTRWTWGWLQLTSEMYHSDAPFWHSGYEERNWEVIAPEATTTTRTLGTETYKGDSAYVLTYSGSAQRGGLRQGGIHLKAGETYDFRIFGGFAAPRNSADRQPVVIRIRPDGGALGVLAETTLQFEPNQREFHFAFQNADFTGRIALEIFVEKSTTLRLSWCSMMPRNTVNGWRPDVVALLKKVRPPIMRFPGGCYASFHDWKSAVGPRSERPAQTSFYWGGLDENDVGTDEFLDLCHEIECEPQICVNMMTSTPFDAADLVEYCNGPAESRMGRFRANNRVTRQNRVTYWEMDNEARRKWSGPAYAREVVRYASAMREVDRNIKIMMESYSYPGDLPQMLEIAGKSVDLVITRSSEPKELHALLNIIRDYNGRNGTRIHLCNTEWLAMRGDAPEPFEDPEIPQRAVGGQQPGTSYKAARNFRQIHWFYALNTARILLGYLSIGGELTHTNFNNCVNTWGQNIIEASKEGAWLSPVGRVYEFLADLEPGCPLQTDAVVPAGTFLTAQACETAEGRGLELLVVNQGTRQATASLQLPSGYRIQSIRVLSAPGRLTRTTLSKDDIKIDTLSAPTSDSYAFRPLSVYRMLATRDRRT